ncbi:MAG: aldo/keto reductase [Thermoproteota archaeon]|nr:aldo/keto reductase [Thermoproteota archaeon]
MEFKELSDGVKIPVLGVGTWKMGGGLRADRTHDKECVLAVRTAIRLGMTHIDTAELYGEGHAEELVGEAIQGFRREQLFITTKVKAENLLYNDVISAIKRSVKRLRTSYVDLYLIHAPNPEIPIKETMKAMDYLVENKLTRFIGVSNFSVEQIKEAQKYARNKIVANQIEYNLLTRNRGQFTNGMESKIVPYCQKNGITVIAYRPLAKGELAKLGIKLLDELAEKYGKTQVQIALNWLISKPNIVTIPKAVKIEHIKENLGAIGWRLSEEDMRRLDYDFPVKNTLL